MTELLKTKCRTCFNAKKGWKSLKTKTCDNKKQLKCYAELLEEITKIQIMDHKYDELPQSICGYCSKRLKSAHAFVQQAKDVNEKLFSMVKDKYNLKQELDCLQEIQIDIESCIKVKQEYDSVESKSDTLEYKIQLGDNTGTFRDDFATNELLPSLEPITKSKCENQIVVENKRDDFEKLEEDDRIDFEDKSKHISLINNTVLEDIKSKPDIEFDVFNTKIDNQSDNNTETTLPTNPEDPQEHTNEFKTTATTLEKKFKRKNRIKKLPTQESQNGIDVAVPCNECNKIFLNAKALRVHQRISHIPEERKCTCSLCGSKFTRYCNMYKHMRTFHGPDSVTLMRKPAEGDNVYECDKCPKKYSRKKSLSYHIRTKHLLAKEDNHNSSQNSSKLKIKAADKGSLCPICGSSFTSKTQLTVHIRRHTGERPFKCDLCERAFLLVTQLNSHKRIHTGEKPYKCQVCSKAFRVSDHLRQHMRSHTDERPYKCAQCERSFKYSQDLSKHLRSNRNERLYGRVCDNSSSRCNNTLRTNYLKMENAENAMNQDV